MSTMFPGQFGPLGYAQFQNTKLQTGVSLLTTVPDAGLAAAGIPKGTKYVLIQAEGVDIRWRDDGFAPTTTVGMILWAGAAPLGFVGNFNVAVFLATQATDATMDVSYYG